MPLTPQEAAKHLNESQIATRRSAQAYGYAKAAPHLILWGIIWAFGYGGTYFLPAYAGWIWLALIACGCFGSFFLGRVGVHGETGPASVRLRHSLRGFGLMAALAMFIMAVYAMFGPPTALQASAFPALLVGLIYFCLGTFWLGTRMAVTGAAIFTLTLGGYFLIPAYFNLWMAFVGGGGLIASGLWLKKI